MGGDVSKVVTNQKAKSQVVKTKITTLLYVTVTN
jgi:hypothetical protein